MVLVARVVESEEEEEEDMVMRLEEDCLAGFRVTKPWTEAAQESAATMQREKEVFIFAAVRVFYLYYLSS